MNTPTEQERRRLSDGRVGTLGTITPIRPRARGDAPKALDALGPHLVPCCFVLLDATIYSAVDGKPKSTSALKRLENIRANPRASLMVDHFAEDWHELWWVRVDGIARVIEHGEERSRAIDHLVAKYEQYRNMRPEGAVVAIDIDAWRSWSAST